MRLINTKTLELEEFVGGAVPRYAILSPTWGADEVTLQEWGDRDRIKLKAGYAKIKGACEVAAGYGLHFVWVDTNCIDKTSSAELSEAINSMFDWYRRSAICLVYLADVQHVSRDEQMTQFRKSRWFTRGWTLQELLAPRQTVFLDQTWRFMGRMTSPGMRETISRITTIKEYYLADARDVANASVSERMSWMANRETTRIEDTAYCLLGIFDINMPLLYGEGARAFLRLQEEIVKTSADQTIFCWESNWPRTTKRSLAWDGVLAPAPSAFRNSAEYVCRRQDDEEAKTYVINNVGISIKLPVVHLGGRGVLAVLDVRKSTHTYARVAVPWLYARGAYVRDVSDNNDPFLLLTQSDIGGFEIPLTHHVPLTLFHRVDRSVLQPANRPQTFVATSQSVVRRSSGLIVAFAEPVRICWWANLENSNFHPVSGKLDTTQTDLPAGGVVLGVQCRQTQHYFTVLIANIGEFATDPLWTVGGCSPPASLKHAYSDPKRKPEQLRRGTTTGQQVAMLRRRLVRVVEQSSGWTGSTPVCAFECLRKEYGDTTYLLCVQFQPLPDTFRHAIRQDDIMLRRAETFQQTYYEEEFLSVSSLWNAECVGDKKPQQAHKNTPRYGMIGKESSN